LITIHNVLAYHQLIDKNHYYYESVTSFEYMKTFLSQIQQNCTLVKMLTTVKKLFGTLIDIVFIVFTYMKTEFQYIVSLIMNKSFSLSTRIVLRLLRIYLDTSTWIVSKILTHSQKGKVPAITDRLLLQSATELVDQIKTGKVCQIIY
jgi:hypothetical protein